MRKWVGLLLVLGPAWQAWAARPMSVGQVEQLLAVLRNKPDAKVAQELEDVQLTERVSMARLARWEAEFPGRRAQEEIVKLADTSAFLGPPKDDVVANPAPDFEGQKRILWQAKEYVETTTSRLPNLFATRTTTHYETAPAREFSDASSQDQILAVDPVALQRDGESSRTVTYRDGHEVLESSAGTRGKEDAVSGLTSSGEFGPILGTVMGDAMHGRFRWLQWEKGADGPVAEFSYAVPKDQSHYRVGITAGGARGWVMVDGPGRAGVKEFYPAYRGAIEIDPATGAILRLSVVPEVVSSELLRSAIVVEYAPVMLGGRSYVCAVRSLAFFKVRQSPPDATPVAAMPVQIKLNDVAFTHYHLLASETRILMTANGNADDGGDSAVPAPGGTAAGPAQDTQAGAVAGPAATPTEVSATQPKSTAASGNALTDGTANLSSANLPSGTLPGNAPPSDALPNDASRGAMVLKVQSKLVAVDVLVTDHDRPVHGVDLSRFHVLQDGQERAIHTFEEVAPAKAPASTPGSAPGEAMVDGAPELPPDTYSNAPTGPTMGAVSVILLDALNTEATDQLYARREMVRSLTDLPAGRPIAVFTLGPKLRLVQGFTADRSKVQSALEDAGTAPPASLLPATGEQAERRAEQDRLTDARVSMKDFGDEDNLAQLGIRVDRTLEAFQELARYLSGIPGRKNLVWVSGSFPLQFRPLTSDPIQRIKQQDKGNFAGKLRTTADLLAAARVAVYPVDARGLLTQSVFDATESGQQYGRADTSVSALGGGNNRIGQDTAYTQQQTGAEHSSMDVLAEDTGGRAVYESNVLQKAIAEALTDGSDYYALSFVPSDEKAGNSGDAVHHIQVRVDGGKYQLAYRRTYYSADTMGPPVRPGGMPLAVKEALVQGAPPSTQILFRARIVPASDQEAKGVATTGDAASESAAVVKGKEHPYVVDLNVDPAGLTFVSGADGASRSQIECVLVAYDTEGKALNTLGRTLTFRFTPQQYQRLRAAGNTVPVRLELGIPGGKIVLRTVVYDPASASIGSLEVPVPGPS